MTPARYLRLNLILGGAFALALLAALFLGSLPAASDLAATILWQIRAPRVLMAALAGAALAGTGALFQALFRNPLADPYILGVSGGAALGGALVSSIGLGSGLGALPMTAMTGGCFAGALLATAVIFSAARRRGELSVQALIVGGAVLNFLSSSLIMFLNATLGLDRTRSLFYWLMGSIGHVTYVELAFVGAAALGVLGYLLRHATTLNALSLGDESAFHLGIRPGRARARLYLAGSLLVALIVSFTGPIGFVGFLVPHAARLAFGGDQRAVLPASLWMGASLLVLADAASRKLLSPAELPIGVLTAIAGAPFFLYMLRRASKGELHE